MTRRYRTARPFTAERAIQRLEAETRFRLDLAHIAGMRAERRRIDRELATGRCDGACEGAGAAHGVRTLDRPRAGAGDDRVTRRATKERDHHAARNRHREHHPE